MIHLITSISRFSIIILFAVYTYLCFAALRKKVSFEKAQSFFSIQTSLMLLILYNAGIVIFLNTNDIWSLIICVLATVYIFAVMLVYKKIYKRVSFSLVNNMCMLLCIGFLILTRLNPDSAKKQFFIAVIALVVTALVPLFIHKIKVLNKLTFIYAAIGIIGLLAVRLVGKSEYGANLSISFGSFSLQPQEIIKVIFVFFVAARLYKSVKPKDVMITTAIAGLHVLILVSSKDLGAAVIFLLTYLIMLYVATGKIKYFLAGIGAGAIAGVLAFFLFSHVRTRVMAWRDPLSIIDTGGYQISQSLFAIGTGGWLGSGLTEGMPNTIPVVTEDFVFAAISEEMGGFFALCLILVCISCFLMFMNVGLLIKQPFYKLIALGLGSVYGIQVFVAIGGVIKFIPSTGITLPFVSYGGSSLLGTMLIFAIIQGLYVYLDKESKTAYEDVREEIR